MLNFLIWWNAQNLFKKNTEIHVLNIAKRYVPGPLKLASQFSKTIVLSLESDSNDFAFIRKGWPDTLYIRYSFDVTVRDGRKVCKEMHQIVRKICVVLVSNLVLIEIKYLENLQLEHYCIMFTWAGQTKNWLVRCHKNDLVMQHKYFCMLLT